MWCHAGLAHVATVFNGLCMADAVWPRYIRRALRVFVLAGGRVHANHCKSSVTSQYLWADLVCSAE